jgi:hypothetical protein
LGVHKNNCSNSSPYTLTNSPYKQSFAGPNEDGGHLVTYFLTHSNNIITDKGSHRDTSNCATNKVAYQNFDRPFDVAYTRHYRANTGSNNRWGHMESNIRTKPSYRTTNTLAE